MTDEQRPAPRLNDAKERELYRRELREVAKLWRYSGLVLLAAALVIGIFDLAPRQVEFSLALVGAALCLVGIVKRTRYHKRRMAGPKA